MPAEGNAALDAGGFGIQAPSVFDVLGEGDCVVPSAPDKAVDIEALLSDKLQESLMESLNQGYGGCAGL